MDSLFTKLIRSLILLLLLSVARVASLLTTSVIDDNDPQVSYPVGDWIARSRTQPCTGCAGAQIDPSQAFRGTWHEESDYAEAEFSFFGTGVEIFAIVRHMPDNQSNYTFQIDGQTAGEFVFIGKGGNIWAYNTSVFARRNLPRAQHRMKIIEGTTSFMAFDWALIEDETPDPAPSTLPSSTSISAPSTATPPNTGTSTPSTPLPSGSTTSFSSSRSTSSSPASGPGGTARTSQPPTSPGGNPNQGSSNQKSSPPPMGIIVGAAVGCTALVGLLIGLLWWLLRRKKARKEKTNGASPTPSQMLPRPFERIRRGSRSNLDIVGDAGQMTQARTGYDQSVPWHPPTVSRNATLATDAGYPARTRQDFTRSRDSPYRSPHASNEVFNNYDTSRREYVRPSLKSNPSLPWDESREGSTVTSHRTGQSSSNGSKARLVSNPHPVETHVIIHEDGGRPPDAPPARGTIIRVEELPPAYANHD